MHKKLEAELLSLAHSILEMKNNNDVAALQKKAQLVYEKLTVLNFVESNLNTSFDNEVEEKVAVNVEAEEMESVMVGVEINKEMEEEVLEEVIEKQETVAFEVEKSIVDTTEEAEEIEPSIEMITEEKTTIVEETKEEEVVVEQKEFEESIISKETSIVEEHQETVTKLQFTLEDELKDAISADVATELFERVTKEHPVLEDKPEAKKKSLNDAVFSANLQVGLNDRIAFVQHLFDGSQTDFNRVLSQLNSFKTEQEAIDFIEAFVKPDYNWAGKEEYEVRLMNLIERKFL